MATRAWSIGKSLIDQSKLPAETFDLLALFDVFEHDSEPFSFRDLILARKYAGLLAGGASWGAVARSVHNAGPVASLTALSLHPGGPQKIYAAVGGTRTELDGQGLLGLEPAEDDSEEYFTLAEDAEAGKLYAEATVLYGRCVALDPSDSVAMYNRANCYRALGERDDAAASYAQAIKVDPSFVEAWFNLAGLMSDEGKVASARRHLQKAIALDNAVESGDFSIPVRGRASISRWSMSRTVGQLEWPASHCPARSIAAGS